MNVRWPAILCALVAASCVRVRPHEREILARPDMQLGLHPELRAGADHAHAYREGSIGGAEAKSGGCGCN